ncbi:hypothetical protein E4U21_003888 [Claviceps maximensis]|nr:hypothetical protein E4U21_003888 [Claviceps maximensis]
MQLKQFLAWPCLLAGLTASASPIEQQENKSIFRRGQALDHDKVQVIPENLPNNIIGRNLKRFQPYLNTEGAGCWPYPAVDSEGNWSAGLALGGSQGGDCDNSVGQVYVRYGLYEGHYGIIYTWFAPKDQDWVGRGHRYDWEGAVIWIDNPLSENPVITGAAVSKHGGWEKTTNVAKTVSFHEGHPLCKYWVDFDFVGTHRVGWTDKVGGLQPAVAWFELTDAARSALQDTNWGHADFMLGYNFERELASAYPF